MAVPQCGPDHVIVLQQMRAYKPAQPTGAVMILSFLLSHLRRSRAFVWAPAVDLKDNEVLSALIPGALQ